MYYVLNIIMMKYILWCKILKWDHEYSYYYVVCELIIKKGDIL